MNTVTNFILMICANCQKYLGVWRLCCRHWLNSRITLGLSMMSKIESYRLLLKYNSHVTYRLLVGFYGILIEGFWVYLRMGFWGYLRMGFWVNLSFTVDGILRLPVDEIFTCRWDSEVTSRWDIYLYNSVHDLEASVPVRLTVGEDGADKHPCLVVLLGGYQTESQAPGTGAVKL